MVDRIYGWLFMIKNEQVDRALSYRILTFEGIPEEYLINVAREYDYKIRKNKEFILGCFEAAGYNWDLESEDCASFLVARGEPYKMVHDCMREYDGKIEDTIASFHKGRRKTSFKEQSILQRIVYLQGKEDTPEEVLDELYKEMAIAQREADKAAGITRRRRGGRKKTVIRKDTGATAYITEQYAQKKTQKEEQKTEKEAPKTRKTRKKKDPATVFETEQKKIAKEVKKNKKEATPAKIIQFKLPEE